MEATTWHRGGLVSILAWLSPRPEVQSLPSPLPGRREEASHLFARPPYAPRGMVGLLDRRVRRVGP